MQRERALQERIFVGDAQAVRRRLTQRKCGLARRQLAALKVFQLGSGTSVGDREYGVLGSVNLRENK